MEVIKEEIGCRLLSANRITDNRDWFQVTLKIADFHRVGIEFKIIPNK